MKVLFLHTELAAYFISCVNAFIRKYAGEVHMVYLPVNAEAPFVFDFYPPIHWHERRRFSRSQLLELVKKISPDVIHCNGWIDKDYLFVCRHFSNSIPVVLGLDNRWKGTLKQRVAALIGKFLIKKHFNCAWVPEGKLQIEYVNRLGFFSEQIITDAYSADIDFFLSARQTYYDDKKKNFPKRFIYAGRYCTFKGVRDLWDAFISLQKEHPNEWELWCLGTGDVVPVQHEKIKHFGFVQPGDMKKYLSETGVFVLPSHFEPWGVVVHEFAAAGFPLICSSEVGAAEAFLEHGKNGYLFRTGDVNELKYYLKKIISLSDSRLRNMGEISVEKAKQITLDIWADKLYSIVQMQKK